MTEHWPSCGNGWVVAKNPTRGWEVYCSGDCRCQWIIDDSTSVAFTLPRPKGEVDGPHLCEACNGKGCR